MHDAIAVTCSTASMGFALEEEYFPNQPPSNESVVQRPSHVVLPKIGISRKNWDFAQKSGFQAPMSKILGFQVHTVGGALRVHFEIPIFCHGRPVGT